MSAALPDPYALNDRPAFQTRLPFPVIGSEIILEVASPIDPIDT